MQILRHENGSFALLKVEQPLQAILGAIPAAIDAKGNRAAMDRLYPMPTTEKDGHGMADEWAEFVQPELRHLFESAASAVREDLEQFKQGEELVISKDHVDAWLNTLNQARLALAARFDITEADIERPVSHVPENERELALFQIHFYGFLQEFMIQGIEEK